ncbi:MAG TPA: hydrogenase maturation protease [Ktedonobacteraceae bacterium]|nr:hydrogenase maturation protease [Ktedonobacteraceae bacterium]
MNVSVRMQPLIIGIGNPLRSDDGLGWAVAELLSQDCMTSYDVQTVHQLTPELALWMATARFVVIIDASHEGEPGKIHIRHLSLPTQQGAGNTHCITPEELVALTSAVYGQCPPVVLVTLTGVDFSVGEKFSPIVAQRIATVCKLVCQLCATGFSLRYHIIE